jgi:hypothetical protein
MSRWSDCRQRLRSVLTRRECVHLRSVFDPIGARRAGDSGFELGMFAGSIASLPIRRAPILFLFSAALLGCALNTSAIAGPAGDELAKCLVRSTAAADKTALVQWMFAMASLHPQVKTMAAISPERRTEATVRAAQMFQRLLTQACVNEARAALKAEGQGALEQSFNALGQVAARELFADPNVAGGIADFEKHIDAQALERALKPAQ